MEYRRLEAETGWGPEAIEAISAASGGRGCRLGVASRQSLAFALPNVPPEGLYLWVKTLPEETDPGAILWLRFPGDIEAAPLTRAGGDGWFRGGRVETCAEPRTIELAVDGGGTWVDYLILTNDESFDPTARAEARKVSEIVSWSPPSPPPGGGASGIAGYTIHYGTASGEYTRHVVVGDQTSARVEGLDPRQRYYFSVTAFDEYGRHSDPSEESMWEYGDGDGDDAAPAAWVKHYFGPEPGPDAAPDTDLDGDGQTTRQEYLAGTDPLDPFSVLQVRIAVSPELIQVAVPSAIGLDPDGSAVRTLRVEESRDGFEWRVIHGLSSVPVSGRPCSIALSRCDQPGPALYRVQVECR